MSGWEPVIVTRYEYDDDGKLIGSLTEREPEWSREDVEALIAYLEAQRVGPHGHPMDEAMSPDGNPQNPDRKWDWYVPLPHVDFAQEALDQVKDAYRKQYPDANMGALRWSVEKRER